MDSILVFCQQLRHPSSVSQATETPAAPAEAKAEKPQETLAAEATEAAPPAAEAAEVPAAPALPAAEGNSMVDATEKSPAVQEERMADVRRQNMITIDMFTRSEIMRDSAANMEMQLPEAKEMTGNEGSTCVIVKQMGKMQEALLGGEEDEAGRKGMNLKEPKTETRAAPKVAQSRRSRKAQRDAAAKAQRAKVKAKTPEAPAAPAEAKTETQEANAEALQLEIEPRTNEAAKAAEQIGMIGKEHTPSAVQGSTSMTSITGSSSTEEMKGTDHAVQHNPMALLSPEKKRQLQDIKTWWETCGCIFLRQPRMIRDFFGTIKGHGGIPPRGLVVVTIGRCAFQAAVLC
eukprot:s974_g16.t3